MLLVFERQYNDRLTTKGHNSNYLILTLTTLDIFLYKSSRLMFFSIWNHQKCVVSSAFSSTIFTSSSAVIDYWRHILTSKVNPCSESRWCCLHLNGGLYVSTPLKIFLENAGPCDTEFFYFILFLFRFKLNKNDWNSRNILTPIPRVLYCDISCYQNVCVESLMESD